MTDKVEDQIRRATAHLKYWQRPLRLDHNDFVIVTANPDELGPNMARCKVAPARHQQKIELQHPDDRAGRYEFYFRRDLEVIVVHELLHTKEMLWRDHPSIDDVFNKDKWLTGLHEDSLDAIAEALVRARRGMTR